MTPSDKAYYSDGYWPLFKLMSDEFGLTLLEQDMSEIMNCVRKMDEAHKEIEFDEKLKKSIRMGLYGADLIPPMRDAFYSMFKRKKQK